MGALHVTVEHRHLWQAKQRDSDTADSGKPRVVFSV